MTFDVEWTHERLKMRRVRRPKRDIVNQEMALAGRASAMPISRTESVLLLKRGCLY
jgi:hypothetical protein